MKSAVIYGPPGTGKTYALVELMRDMNSAVVLSHTKNSAKVLKQRSENKNIKPSTIHSLAFSIVGASKSQMIDASKLDKFSKTYGFRFNHVHQNTEADFYYSLYKFSRITKQAYQKAWAQSYIKLGSEMRYLLFCRQYLEYKRTSYLLDFEDLLEHALEYPSPRIENLIIDEGQDLGPLQFDLIQKWIDDQSIDKVILAGDDDQCIFQWNGANSASLSQFEEKYDSERVILKKSFRVPKSVHSVAQRIVNKVRHRIDKAYLPRDAEGSTHIAYNLHGVKFGPDCAVIYRNHGCRKIAEELLIAQGVPYRTFTGPKGYLDCMDYRLVKAWIQGLNDADSFNKNKPFFRKNAQFKGDIENYKKVPWDRLFPVADKKASYYKKLMRKGEFLSPNDYVTLKTIHSAKGEEFKQVVYINSMSNRTMQSAQRDMDSEYRCAYVAATRTIEDLTILYGPNPLRL